MNMSDYNHDSDDAARRTTHEEKRKRLTRDEIETHGAQRKEVKRRVVVLQHLDVDDYNEIINELELSLLYDSMSTVDRVKV
jgi:hypothetical protein